MPINFLYFPPVVGVLRVKIKDFNELIAGIYLSKDHCMQVTAFERAGMEQYLLQSRLQDREQVNTKVHTTASK